MTTNNAKSGGAVDLRPQPGPARPLWHRLKSALHRSGAARQLHDLSDASLRDIGLTRPYFATLDQPRRSLHI